MIKETKNAPETEVDFVNLARTIWDGRKLIGKLILTTVILGFIISILIPNSFTASSTFVPQISDPKSKLGGLSGLAAIAGVNISSITGSELSPRTYSSILSSQPFQLELMNTKLNFNRLDTSITLFDYYTKIKLSNPLIKYTLGLPHLIVTFIKGKKTARFKTSPDDPFYQLSLNQIEVQKILEKQISIYVNDKDGDVTLNCALPEAYAAAQLAQNAQVLLQRYITEFKIEKAKSNLEFILHRYNESGKKYQHAQNELASFRDRNKNVATSIAKTEEERLMAEYTLISGVHYELAKKLEQAKIEVKEETPIFTIIKPVSIPIEKSYPNRPLILAFSAFFGLIFGIALILSKDFWIQTLNKWRKMSIK
jgi:uncharacterized protein involved in exopolysaccharide biosynthesis